VATIVDAASPSATLLWGGKRWASGSAQNYPTSNGGIFDGSSFQATPAIPGTGAYEGPIDAATVSSKDRFWVWGGLRFDGTHSPPFFDSDLGWFFHPPSSSWTPISPGGPSARRSPVAVWTGSEIVVWGGDTGAGALDDGKIFHPCPMGQHPCSGACRDDTDVLGCGTTSCAPCPVPPNAHATCDGTNCGYECNAGFHDCGGACVSSSDPLHCGSSCSACPDPANGTATCDGTSCGASCNPGFTACGASCLDTTNDGDNCGSCGVSCSGGFCENGVCHTPEVVASGQSSPVAIAVDATSVYFGEAITGGAIKKRPIAGGSLVTLASNQHAPYELALDATHARWFDYFGGTVAEVPLSGGTVTTLGVGPGDVAGVAVDASGVYWTTTTGTVMKVPLSGGTPTPIVTWSGGYGGPIVSNGSSIFWISSDTTLRKASTSGANATVFASGQLQPSALAFDSSSLYWTNYSNWTVMKLPLGGGAPIELVQTSGGPRDIAIDATHVYWAQGDGVAGGPNGGG
jgi:hypothetical protein